MNIVIYSIDSGFGPISKAIIVGEHLHLRHNVRLMTYGHALNLAQKSVDYVSVLDCINRNVSNWRRLFSEYLNSAEIFICVMDHRVAREFAHYFPHVPILFIDSLLWWNPESVDLTYIHSYIAQYFPGVEIVAKKFANKKIHIVSPILSLRTDAGSSHDTILMNLGGLSSKFMADDRCLLFVEQLVNLVQGIAPNIRTVIAGNCQIMTSLMFRSSDNTKFGCFAHSRFMEELLRARCFITLPGVEAIFEAIEANIPIILLPPISNSQSHQLIKYSNKNLCSTLTPNQLQNLETIVNSFSYEDSFEEIVRFSCTIVHNEPDFVLRLQKEINVALTQGVFHTSSFIAQRSFVPANLPNGLDIISQMITEISGIGSGQ
jgi:hypothetical protein